MALGPPQFFRRLSPDGFVVEVTPETGTGVGNAAGCGFFPAAPFSPLVVDNENNTYFVRVIVASRRAFQRRL